MALSLAKQAAQIKQMKSEMKKMRAEVKKMQKTIKKQAEEIEMKGWLIDDGQRVDGNRFRILHDWLMANQKTIKKLCEKNNIKFTLQSPVL